MALTASFQPTSTGAPSPTEPHHRPLHAAQDAGRVRSPALAKGLDPATPAIAVASATLPDETHAAGKIADIGALAFFPPARRSPSSSAGSADGSSAHHPDSPFAKLLPHERPRFEFQPPVLPISSSSRRRASRSCARSLRRPSGRSCSIRLARTAPVMLHLAKKAFFPAPCRSRSSRRHGLEVPRHVRPSRPRCAEPGVELIVYRNPEAERLGSTLSIMAPSIPTCGRPKG